MLSSDFVTAPLLMFTLSSNLCYSTRSVSTQRTDYSQYTGLRTLAATTPPPSRPTNERDSQFHKKIPRPTHCHSSHPQHFSRATSSLSKVPPQKGGAQTPLCKCRTFTVAPVKRVSTLGTPSTQLLRRIAKRFLLLMFTLSGTFDYSCLL
jgi:hypothetical protein